jgi:alpha-1,2-mannosyltransferase
MVCGEGLALLSGSGRLTTIGAKSIAKERSAWSVRPRLALFLLWFVATAIPLFLIGHDVALVRNGKLWNAAFWGRDFVIWWTAGQLIAKGAIATVYNLPAFNGAIASFFGPLDPMGYPYPPITFPISAAFGLLPYWIAQPSWCAIGAALFLYASRPWWTKEMGPHWLAIVTPAALMNIWAGHWGFFHGALFLMGWQRLERQPRLAGAFFGAMLIKPHLALLVPIVLLVRRSWTAFVAAALTTAGLIGGSLLVYGWESWYDYFLNMISPQLSVIGIDNAFFAFMSTSTTTSVLRATGNEHLALWVQLIVSSAALATMIVAARRNVRITDLALLTATLTFLVLPYGFDYDLTAVMIGSLSIVSRSQLPLRWRLMAGAGFLAPGIGLLLSSDHIPVVPLMLALLAYAQFRALRDVTEVPRRDMDDARSGVGIAPGEHALAR